MNGTTNSTPIVEPVTFVFTGPLDTTKADGGLEDLCVLLRDGIDPVSSGTVDHGGHHYVYVEYAYDAVTAAQFYDANPTVGMWQRGGR